MTIKKHILPIIVFSQFCCTSLWFAGNAVMADLISIFNLDESSLGHLISALQFGFISGTFLFALLTITDRFSPSKVFLFSAIIAAVFNNMMVFNSHGLLSLLTIRFLTGFFLAGIYPVGMKIAADYYEVGLGKSLGFLVGALVLGTAFPHILNAFGSALNWESIVYITTALAILGGLLMVMFVPNGPFRKSATALDFSVLYKIFKPQKFKQAAFGYFGHMWELYTFWAFVPVILIAFKDLHPSVNFNIPVLSFLIIGSGALACVVSGYLSNTFGVKKVATIALTLSCLCCLVSPLFFMMNNKIIFIGFLIFWGMVVIADSPLFSTLVAKNAIQEHKGTALTIVNSIGFAITIVSIQLLNQLRHFIKIEFILLILAIGPILGLVALFDRKLN